MDRHQFHNVIREYRSIMECCTPADSWMDWRSDVYVHGTWRCVRIADHYLRPGSRVLDLGCGLGLFTILLSRYGHTVVGVDIDVGGRREEVKQSYRAGWGSCRDELENPKMMTDCWKELVHIQLDTPKLGQRTIPGCVFPVPPGQVSSNPLSALVVTHVVTVAQDELLEGAEVGLDSVQP